MSVHGEDDHCSVQCTYVSTICTIQERGVAVQNCTIDWAKTIPRYKLLGGGGERGRDIMYKLMEGGGVGGRGDLLLQYHNKCCSYLSACFLSRQLTILPLTKLQLIKQGVQYIVQAALHILSICYYTVTIPAFPMV